MAALLRAQSAHIHPHYNPQQVGLLEFNEQKRAITVSTHHDDIVVSQTCAGLHEEVESGGACKQCANCMQVKCSAFSVTECHISGGFYTAESPAMLRVLWAVNKRHGRGWGGVG